MAEPLTLLELHELSNNRNLGQTLMHLARLATSAHHAEVARRLINKHTAAHAACDRPTLTEISNHDARTDTSLSSGRSTSSERTKVNR